MSAIVIGIKNEGETDFQFDTEDCQKLSWTFQIAEVNKVLASVSYLADHNHRVVLGRDLDSGEDVSFIANKTNGESVKMRRDRNVWVIDAYIDNDTEQGFNQPVATP